MQMPLLIEIVPSRSAVCLNEETLEKEARIAELGNLVWKVKKCGK